MTEEININTEVSKLLSSALARAKIVRDNLQLTKFYAHITEYLVATLHGKHFIQTGSCMEQSLIPGSDVDQMQIFSDTCAADSPNQVMIKKCHLLIMDTDDSRHGFSKLRLNHLLDKKDLTRQILEESLVCGEANSEYISSNRFSASFLKLRSATFEFSPFGPRTTAFFRHGPCSTIELDHSQQADIAVGIECANWPREAKEWCTRPRFYGWPSKNTVSALSKLPCYLLPVGDECSTNCALEWRFAFVPTERELIWEFSDTQIQCYVILKLLRKKFLEPIAPDQLSSFFLKTIVFWEIENKGPDAWTSENLIHCIVSCLQSLRECVMTKTLPHYIFRKRNLLFTKFRDREIQTAVVNKLEDLEKNTAPYVLQAATGFAPLDDLGKIWSNCKGSLACFINTRREQMLHIPELLEKTHRSYYYGRFIFIRIVGVRQQLEKLIEAGLYITEHESEFDSLFRKHALSCLKIEIGKRYIPEIFNPDTELPKTKLITTIYNLFAGATIGSTIGCLHLATLHYLLREYTKALTIIHSLISKKGHLFFIGLSAEKISLEEQNYPECIDVCPTLENLVAHDIYFSSEDVVWAPPGVGLECALLGKRYNWNFCVFHPLVYSYYLLFLICLKRKQVKECKQCLQEFSDFLSFDGGKIDRHRSLNLLGFCNYKLGYYDKAVSCFERSLQIVGPVGNAASYHICILITELLAEQTCRRAKDKVIYTRTSGPNELYWIESK
ncbi:uncharacterized protein LOC128545875 [Mercenaria mercenaria]|uniref:uncharacterized protein LOC128545875 n=1 Tax=Mercenaria mercenaria TaxID=6596 RepID=UPI00234EB4BD|nr:uncharacterized protein LOC128545875 [Mercenaria mercenaria]XP_053373113.1 uncharacterized protein LOC128545875 [Mercenaria mercenaria]